MNKQIILVVDDEAEVREVIEMAFKNDFKVLSAASANDALALCEHITPDLIISDYNMPNGNGLNFCQEIRSSSKLAEVPFLIISAHSEENLRVESFASGADDYIIKPFSLRELKARVSSKLKWQRSLKGETVSGEGIAFGNISINFKSGIVQVGESPVNLTRFEIKLLTYFIENSDKKLKRDDILMDVWAPHIVSSRTIDAHICALRQKLVGFDYNFQTVRGFGYQLIQNNKLRQRVVEIAS